MRPPVKLFVMRRSFSRLKAGKANPFLRTPLVAMFATGTDTDNIHMLKHSFLSHFTTTLSLMIIKNHDLLT